MKKDKVDIDTTNIEKDKENSMIPFLFVNAVNKENYSTEFLEVAKSIHELANRCNVKSQSFEDINNKFGYYITDGINKGFSLVELFYKIFEETKNRSDRLEEQILRLEKINCVLEKSVDKIK